MRFRISKRTSFFMAGGGGARGRIAGIVRAITTEIGHTIKALRHFTGNFHPPGAATIISSAGKDINGSSAAFLNMKLSETGAAGKKTGIGKNRITGECAAWIPDKRIKDIITREEIITKEAAAWTAEDRKIPILKTVIPETEKRPGT